MKSDVTKVNRVKESATIKKTIHLKNDWKEKIDVYGIYLKKLINLECLLQDCFCMSSSEPRVMYNDRQNKELNQQSTCNIDDGHISVLEKNAAVIRKVIVV